MSRVLDTGEVVAITPPGQWRVWHEWEQASRGRRQITWSRGRPDPMSEREVLWNALLASRGASADATDEEIAVEDVDGDVVGEINRADWYRTVVWRPELIAEILEAAETNGAESVRMLLAGCGVALVDRSPPLLAG